MCVCVCVCNLLEFMYSCLQKGYVILHFNNWIFFENLEFQRTCTLYPVCTDHALSEYCTYSNTILLHYSWWHSALHTLSSPNTLTEVEPEILLHICVNINSVAVIALELKGTKTLAEACNLYHCSYFQPCMKPRGCGVSKAQKIFWGQWISRLEKHEFLCLSCWLEIANHTSGV